jgi:hypothetical protein
LANQPISGLTAGVPVTDPNLFANVQAPSAGPVKTTALELKTYIGTNLTLTGTTTIPNPLVLNGVSYNFPAANGINGSVLVNNGTGTLTWSTNPGIGTVTSVGLDASIVGLTVANSPVTGSGTLTINGGVLNIANGGTGAATPAAALINLLPATAPSTAGYALFNDGVGNFYWAAASGGGGGGGGVLSVSTTVNGLTVTGGTGNAVLSGVVGIAGGGTGATTAIAARNALLPSQSSQGGKVLGTDGNNVSWVAIGGTGTVTSVSLNPSTTGLTVNGGTAPVAITAAGTFTLGGILSVANGGTGLSALGTGVQTALGVAVNTNGGMLLGGTGGILPIARGGTNLGAAPTAGQLLIGNGTGYTLATLTPGTGITIDNSVPGAITINSTGGGGGGSVVSVNSAVTGFSFTNPTANAILTGTLGIANGGTNLTTTPTAGQLLIGNNTGYTLATLTAGTGVTIDDSTTPGQITISATATAGVTSFSTGTTGLQPAAVTTGAIVLAGTLNLANGGTGLSTVGASGTALVSNGTALAYGNPLYATNLIGATANTVPYQSAANTTAFAGPGTAGTYLAGNGAGSAPSFKAATLTLGATPLNLNATTTAITGMTGITMTAGYSPAGDDDVATKDYVDSFIVPVNRVSPANVATTTNLASFSGFPTIDGYTVSATDRVLVKNQTSSQDNGVYSVDGAGVWTRATDLDAPSEFTSASVFVLNGSTQANTSWIQTATVTSVGTSPQTWQQQSGIYNYVAGTGIGISGYTINNNGVLTWSGGTTGLTPAAATSGAITLGGTLLISNGGTSATTAQGARTNILPTQAGQNGKFLQSNGTDVIWAASSGGAVYYIPLATGGQLSTKITAAGYTDAVGNSYVLYNNTAANIALTASSFPNSASFPDCTATSITVGAGKTLLVSTTSILATGTYVIGASNYLSGGVSVKPVSGSTTITAYLATIPIVDNEGNVYVITNTGGSAAIISGLVIDNPSSFPGFTTASSFTIPAGGTAVIVSTVAAVNYEVQSISNSVSTNLSGGAANQISYQTAVDTTGFLPTGTAGQYLTSGGSGAAPSWVTLPKVGAYYKDITLGDTVQNILLTAPNGEVQYGEYTLYNSSTSSVAVSNTGGWSNGTSWPINVVGNNLNIAPSQSVTISVQTVGSIYAIIASSSPNSTASAVTATANGTITAALAAANIVQNPGMLVTIRNTAAANASITLTGTLTNFAPWAPAASGASVIIQNGECVTLRVVTAGSAYDIVNLTAQNVAFDSTGDVTLSATITTYGMQVGQLVSITNTKPLGNIVLIAADIENTETYPVQSTATVFTLPKDGTVTLQLTSSSNSNWRIVSFEYPGLQAGAVVFRGANSASYTDNGVIGGATILATISGVNYRNVIFNAQAVAANNPQGYYDATTGRYQPLVAGYYEVNFRFMFRNNSTSGTSGYVGIFKNGSIISNAFDDTASFSCPEVGTVIYMNGTTDYLQVGASIAAGASVGISDGSQEWDAALVTQQKIINTTSGIYNVPVTADTTIPALLAADGISEVVNDLYIITNATSANVTLTATSFIGYQAYPSQATATNIVMTPGSTLELQNVTIGTGYQIVILNTPINVGSVMFSANGPVIPVPIGTVNAYPAAKIILPNIYGGAAIGNPQNYYNPTTGRFTPLTAGFYQVNASIHNDGGYDYLWLIVYKNGTAVQEVSSNNPGTYGTGIQNSTVVYMNGTTDYLELGAYYGPNSATPVVVPGYRGSTRFSAVLINQTLTEVVGTTAAGFVGKNAAQAIASATLTKITFAAPSGQNDPQSWWNAANNRYIPTIPGYYQVSLLTTYASPQAGTYENQIFKNGSVISNALGTPTSGYLSLSPSVVVYMNGSTDYLEAFVYQASGSSQNLEPFSQRNNFSISLVGANQAVEAVTQTTSAYGIGSYNSGNNAARYAVAQLDNIIIYQQYQAGFGFATVTGTTQLQGSISSSFYDGGAGTASITNTTGSGPLTITTAGGYVFTANRMSCWTANFRDLTANISYRATFILQHGYVNSQCFLERIGGQQI